MIAVSQDPSLPSPHIVESSHSPSAGIRDESDSQPPQESPTSPSTPLPIQSSPHDPPTLDLPHPEPPRYVSGIPISDPDEAQRRRFERSLVQSSTFLRLSHVDSREPPSFAHQMMPSEIEKHVVVMRGMTSVYRISVRARLSPGFSASSPISNSNSSRRFDSIESIECSCPDFVDRCREVGIVCKHCCAVLLEPPFSLLRGQVLSWRWSHFCFGSATASSSLRGHASDAEARLWGVPDGEMDMEVKESLSEGGAVEEDTPGGQKSRDAREVIRERNLQSRVLLQDINEILNKLSPLKYGPLRDRLVRRLSWVGGQGHQSEGRRDLQKLRRERFEVLDKIVHSFFGHAVQSPSFGNLFADLCCDLCESDEFVRSWSWCVEQDPFDDDVSPRNDSSSSSDAEDAVRERVRRILLDLCQDEFGKLFETCIPLDLFERKQFLRRVSGTLFFVGSMFLKRVFSSSIIHLIMCRILRHAFGGKNGNAGGTTRSRLNLRKRLDQNEVDQVCLLCEFFKRVGKGLVKPRNSLRFSGRGKLREDPQRDRRRRRLRDQKRSEMERRTESDRRFFDYYFRVFESLSQSPTVQMRVKCECLDLLELRNSGPWWSARGVRT